MSLHYPFGETPAPGKLFQICAGVFWLRLPLPFQLDHINLWLLRDGDGWTLVGARGNRSAQYEHTMVITRDEPIVLTVH